jgi:outer membrane protein assembly factor BamB
MTDTPMTRRALLAAVGVAGVPAVAGGSRGLLRDDAVGDVSAENPAASRLQAESVRWAGPGNGPANDGRTTAAGPTGGVRTEWTHMFDRRVDASPAIVGNRAIVAAGTAVVALNLTTGEELWRAEGNEASAVVPDGEGRVLAPADDRLVGIDVSSGEELWRRSGVGDSLRAPAVDGDRAYVAAGGDGEVLAVETTGGETQWRTAIPGDWLPGRVGVGDGTVYAASPTGTLVALDAESGERRWETDLVDPSADAPPDREYGLTASPAVADGRVVVGDETGRVHAVDTDGTVEWSLTAVGRKRASETGAELGELSWSAPSIGDGVAYVGCEDGRLYAVDLATGEVGWRFWAWGRIDSKPAVTDAAVYVGCADTMVYALDRTTGERLWEASTGSRVAAGPAVVDGLVVAPSAERIVAVGGERGQSRDASPTEPPGAVVPSAPDALGRGGER